MRKKINLINNKVNILLVIAIIVIFNLFVFIDDECSSTENHLECICVCPMCDFYLVPIEVDTSICTSSFLLPQEQYIIQKDFVKSILEPHRI